MREIKAPEPFTNLRPPVYFLAGSIEMGNAENWQDRLIKKWRNKQGTVLNPRRDEWDSTWTQSINNPKFKEQVLWELNGLELADKIFLYFDPSTKSPISLLELGLYARTGKLLVCCPKGFWRRGNVEVVCEKYNAKLVDENDFFQPTKRRNK
jgi:hypothetical protein